MSSVEIAWAAGLFQGSGHAGFHRHGQGDHRQLRAVLVLTTAAGEPAPEALRRFYDAIGRYGNVDLEKGRPYKSPSKGRLKWEWVATNDDAAAVIDLVLPYLHDDRRDRTIAALVKYREARTTAAEAEAWAAGLFQASGSSGFYRDRNTWVLRAQMQLTSDAGGRRPEALDRFYGAIDRLGGLGNGSEYGKRRRLAWPWAAANDDARKALERFRPYLHGRRALDARVAVAAYDEYKVAARNKAT